MFSYRFYRFSDNITERVLADHSSDNTIFVFPTIKSCKEAVKHYQESWNFSNNIFITMEEFKETLYHTELPILKEDKRTIALYNSLSENHRKKLNITDYFSFITFAGNFFSFWEEFNEELIPTAQSLEELIPGAEILPWQNDLFALMQDILGHYEQYLKSRNFTDLLFLYDRQTDYEKIVRLFPFLADNDNSKGVFRIVTVNQHYYTNLENFLLKKLSQSSQPNFAVTVCYQLPEEYLDKERNAVKSNPDFSLADRLTKKLTVNIGLNDLSLLNALARETAALSQADNSLTVIDSGFYRSSYSRFFSVENVYGRSSELVANSSIYRFLIHLETLLSNLIIEDNGTILLPVNILLPIISDDLFLSRFISDTKEKRAYLNYLESRLRNDFCYLHLSEQKPLARLNSLISQMLCIKSIPEFISLIGRESAIDIEQIVSPNEETAANLCEVCYQSLANLSALDSLQVIEAKTFGGYTNPVKWILKLFLQNLKPKRFSYAYQRGDSRIDISSLLDSRNISYKNVALFNVNEGLLPSSRSTPFLLSESQRRELGLKTYEDIRERERYYFFRLILNSANVWIFSQDNPEISSFVEELIIKAGETEPSLLTIKHYDSDKYAKLNPSLIDSSIAPNEAVISNLPDYTTTYSTLLKSDSGYQIDKEIVKTPAFYIFPLDRERDLPDNTLTISGSGYDIMNDSLIAFYLRDIAGIDEEMSSEPLSARLVGTIAHSIFETIWKRLDNVKTDSSIYDDAHRLKSLVFDAGRETLQSPSLQLKIPKTYKLRFFREAVMPIICDSILVFFANNRNLLTGDNCRNIPEIKTMKTYAELDAPPSFDVLLKGRTDLILESGTSDKQFHIFDYKTGSIDNKRYASQLMIYELLTAANPLFASPAQLSVSENNSSATRTATPIRAYAHIHSYLFSLMDGTQKELTSYAPRKTKEEQFAEWSEKLTASLATIDTEGFTYGSKSGNKYYNEVIRTDLLRKYILL